MDSTLLLAAVEAAVRFTFRKLQVPPEWIDNAHLGIDLAQARRTRSSTVPLILWNKLGNNGRASMFRMLMELHNARAMLVFHQTRGKQAMTEGEEAYETFIKEGQNYLHLFRNAAMQAHIHATWLDANIHI